MTRGSRGVLLAVVATMAGGMLVCGDEGQQDHYPIRENATCKHEGDYAVTNDGVGLTCKRSDGRLRWRR
jgi:hypothetical protein